MTDTAHALAALLYVVGAVLAFGPLVGPGARRVTPWLLGAGAIVHAAGFVALHRVAPVLTLESLPVAFSLIGWLVPVAYLLSLGFARVRDVGLYVGLVAGFFTTMAWLGLQQPVAPTASTSHTWSHVHTLLSTFGFSLLALASLAGVAYLAKERSLKRRGAARLTLPPLESLDRLGHFTLSLGFALLTLGMLAGFAWSSSRGGSPWTEHSGWLVAAWLLYLLPVSLRVVRKQHGPQPARGVVFGFAFLAFSYIGVRLLGGAP
jgi:ABC-type uncharacterized transport system permease subunit